MKNFISLVLLFIASLLTAIQADDQSGSAVCHQPFVLLLQCVVGDVEGRFKAALDDKSGTGKTRIQHCFTSNGCTAPTFNEQQAINLFLKPEWAARLELFFDLVSQTPANVQHCMTDYFKELARKKSEDCIREFGGPELQDFIMPPIPGLYSFKLEQIKETFLNRMLIRHAMINCAACIKNVAVTKQIIDCVADMDTENTNGACAARDQCAAAFLETPLCTARYHKVQQAACKCSAAKLRITGLSSLVASFEELKSGLISGGFAEQYKQCFSANNAPFPQAAFDKANTAIQQSVVDIAFSKNGLDNSLKYALSLAVSLLKDTADQWKDLYCTSCTFAIKSRSDQVAGVLQKIADTGIVTCGSLNQ